LNTGSLEISVIGVNDHSLVRQLEVPVAKTRRIVTLLRRSVIHCDSHQEAGMPPDLKPNSEVSRSPEVPLPR
jgi:hypothetical protein